MRWQLYFNWSLGSSECLLLLCCLSSSPRIWALWDLCWMASPQVRVLLSPGYAGYCGMVCMDHELLTSVALGWLLLLGSTGRKPWAMGSAFRAFVSLAPSLGSPSGWLCFDWKSQVLPSGLSHKLGEPLSLPSPSSPVLVTVTILCDSPMPADTLNYPCLKSLS